MKKKIITRVIAAMCCLLTLIGIAPAFAKADTGDTVTITSEGNDAFDYLQYYSSGKWRDLNTPKHWVEATGEVCYCIEHSLGNPHGTSYSETDVSNVFSENTVLGLQAILMYGYPCNTPEGFTEDEARQATANAIRFWLSENGEAHTYNFTNRKKNPNSIRAKDGYEHVLEWADELLQLARDHAVLEHSITFSQGALPLTKSGSNFTGSLTVTLDNINSGYTLDTSTLPEGTVISGYTGTKSETITFTAPRSASGQTFTVTAIGKDTRSLENIVAYLPSGSSVQKICLCATTAQVVATAAVGVNTPALGNLSITKTAEDGSRVAGAKYGIYSDSSCTSLLAEAETGSDGKALAEDLPATEVFVKELSVGEPYVLSDETYNATVTLNGTAELSVTDETAQGRIAIEKTAEQMTGTEESENQFGTAYHPVFNETGLAGCVFEVYDSANILVATLTTDENGHAETGILPLGTYKVQETSTVTGYVLDEEIHTVTLAYKDMNTPVVTETLNVKNERISTSVSVKKMTERFNTDTFAFEACPGEGFVFGLYTAETIGILPRDTMVELLTTGSDGTVKTTVQLPFGKYYLRELSSPLDTVEVSSETFPLTVSGDNTDYVMNPVVNDMFKGTIAVWKSDADDSKRNLLGAVYEVRNSEGTLYCTMSTDKDGYACSIDLPVGTYEVKEVTPPAGYILEDEITEVTISTDDKNTLQFDKTNKENTLTISKTDLTTGKVVEGAEITIYDSEGNVFCKGITDVEGKLTVTKIPAGTYTYQETASPDGYALNTETFTFTMNEYGDVSGNTEITNDPSCVKIYKTNTYTGEAFPNIEFTLYSQDGKILKTKLTESGYRVLSDDGEETFKVDSKGYAELRYMPEGTYTLVENTPSGYISEDTTFTVTKEHSTEAPLVLNISNTPTGLKICKVDASTGNPLTGAAFKIKVKNGSDFVELTFTQQADGNYFCDSNGTVTELPVDSLGIITVYGLPLGTVWIEESVTPDGYFPISSKKIEITKDVTNTAPYELTVKNSKYVKLGMDSDWWEFPALCAGVSVVIIGGVLFIILKRKKRKSR